MSIIGNPIMAGASGPAASIFVTGLSETDTVTAVKDGKTVKGVWQKGAYEETESPDMTSNTAPSGVASASSEYSGNPAYLSFDSSNTSFWQPVAGATAKQTWIQYEFAEEIIPDSVFIGGCCSQSSTAQLGGSSKNAVVKFQGSLDGSSWFDISENFTVNFPSTATGFVDHGTEQLNNTATRYVRMQYVSTELPNNGVNIEGVGSVCPATIKIYGQKVVEVPGFVIEPIRDFGTWTVTATDGTKTATQDVLVDVITNYEIEMDLTKLWLYRDGDECEDVTGGWEGYTAEWSSEVKGQFSVYKRDTYLECYGKNGAGSCFFTTANPIDVTNYTQLHFVSKRSNSSGGSYMRTSTTKPYYSTGNYLPVSTDALSADFPSTEKTEAVLDISAIAGDIYILMLVSGYTSYLYEVWLE